MYFKLIKLLFLLVSHCSWSWKYEVWWNSSTVKDVLLLISLKLLSLSSDTLIPRCLSPKTQLRKSLSGSVFSGAVVAASGFWAEWKRFPFMIPLTLGKNGKSHSTGAGEWGGWGSPSQPFCGGLWAAPLATLVITSHRATHERDFQNCCKTWQESGISVSKARGLL